VFNECHNDNSLSIMKRTWQGSEYLCSVAHNL
jgi:hypothetical protein